MDERPLSSIVKELLSGMSSLIRNEVWLAKSELKASVKDATQFARISIISGVALFFGAFAFLAFAIIGLGQWMNNYWLSSLIVSLALMIPSAVALLGAYRRAEFDFTLSRTQDNLQKDQALFNRKLEELSSTERPVLPKSWSELTQPSARAGLRDEMLSNTAGITPEQIDVVTFAIVGDIREPQERKVS